MVDYDVAFEMAKGLPPKRGKDHPILIKEGSGLVQVWPYRYIILVCGVAVDHKKVDNVRLSARPKSTKGVNGFVELAGYYRKFVKDYGKIAKPVTKLLKKKKKFH